MTISEKIYLLRKRNGLSQEQLANVLNVSRQAISKWEQATAVPDINSLIRLSEYFKVSVDSIVKDYMELDYIQTEISNEDTYLLLKRFYREKLEKPFLCMIVAVTVFVAYNQVLNIIKPPLNNAIWKYALGLGAPMWKCWLVVCLLTGIYLWLKKFAIVKYN
ncbi:MAG: helix-turn-helix transcriptional regulator [Oscillospiraceae bacterium]|nr:helix-turn-helix transcriptional regulator [Oscillospiraceae bacterium]